MNAKEIETALKTTAKEHTEAIRDFLKGLGYRRIRIAYTVADYTAEGSAPLFRDKGWALLSIDAAHDGYEPAKTGDEGEV